MPFKLNVEGIEEEAEERIADRVVEIVNATREAIRAEVIRAFREKKDSREIARELRTIVGLHSRAASAVQSYRLTLEGMGLPDTRIDQLVERYAQRKLRARAKTIARTETMIALNRGTEFAWEQAIDAEALPDGMVKVWIITPDDELCPICEPMRGEVTEVGEDFTESEGPPAHPQCRCTIGLKRG